MPTTQARCGGIELDSLMIAPHFCGPPGTGNGGYVAGRLAAQLRARGPLEVTLRRPTPVATRLAIRSVPGPQPAWTLGPRDEVVAEARPSSAREATPPLRPAPGAVPAPGERADHPFPGCFVCGPGRPAPDGLGLAPAPIGSGGAVAACWRPRGELTDASGHVATAVVWAALDCPGYFAITGDGPLRPLLLGRMTAAVEAPVRAGEQCVVVAWPLGDAGRQHHTATALLDATGRVRAWSRQVWIAPRAARHEAAPVSGQG